MLKLFRRGTKEAPPIVRGTLEISRPWARPSSHPRPNDVAGAFLSIANKGPDDDRLVAASSPMADHIEIHGIKVANSDIEMRPMANGLALRAGLTVVLKPRGYHLLLKGMKAPLLPGSTLPLALTFEKAGVITVDFAVEEPGLIGEAILNEEHHRG